MKINKKQKEFIIKNINYLNLRADELKACLNSQYDMCDSFEEHLFRKEFIRKLVLSEVLK